TPPRVGLIVKQDAGGVWRDDNGTDWTEFVSGANAGQSGRPVGWTLLDHDVAVINANNLTLSYIDHMMNLCMAIGVKPNGDVSVVGTDAINEMRFEPNVNSIFVRSKLALASPGAGTPSSVLDLNPHLDYA